MNHIVLKSKVGSDGVLHLAVPVGKEAADKEVQITVEPVAPEKAMTQTEWAARVQSMAGSITDPTFRRHKQGGYEQREELS